MAPGEESESRAHNNTRGADGREFKEAVYIYSLYLFDSW